MLSSELEVRPPASDKKEAKYLTGNCVKIYRDGNLVAYAEMRTVGSHTEISTVLVDTRYRNQGIGKELIEKAIREIENNKILCCMDWATTVDVDLSAFAAALETARVAAMKSKDFSQVDQMKAMLTGAGVEVRMSKAGVDLLPSAGFDATKLEPSP